MRERIRIGASVAVASLTTLLLELTATRVLSFVFFNHVVYLTVAIALLGFGVSGTLVSLLGVRRAPWSTRILPWLWVGLGVSVCLALAFTAAGLPRISEASPLAKLTLCYGFYTVPFVCSGAILASIFSSPELRLGRLYALDLVAAGGACVLFFWLLPALGAVSLLLGCATLAFGMATWWIPASAAFPRVLGGIGAGVALLAAAATAWRPDLVDVQPEPYKAMAAHVHRPGAQLLFTRWTPLCRIDVVSNGAERPHGHPHHVGTSYRWIEQDADAPTPLSSRHGIEDARAEIRDGDPIIDANLVYSIRPGAETAVIGVGGGMDVVYALASGARSVVGVELNPATHEVLTRRFSEYTGDLAADPRVTLINGEGRATLRSLDRRFDNIQLIGVDTFAALSSGAYVLSENYLYTVEAFGDLFDRLKDDGILLHRRWLMDPPREDLRLTTIACELLRRRGTRDCGAHVMVVGMGPSARLGNESGHWASSLFKSAFTVAEVEQLVARASSAGLTVLHWPKVLAPAEQSAREVAYYARSGIRQHSAIAALNECTKAYAEGTEQEFLSRYVYNVSPTTDDSPFFFEHHRLNAFGLPRTSVLRGDSVGRTLYVMIGQATVLVLLAVFLPLFRFQRGGLRVAGAGVYAVYFASVGFGFMLVEIALVQKCVLFLGNPLYSLPVVLATLLTAAGVGSHLLGRTQLGTPAVVIRMGIPLLMTIALAAAGLTPLFRALLQLPFGGRVAFTVVCMAPFGLLMGTFFPSGLQTAKARAADFVPWAWGVNGTCSVYGSIVAILIALVHGFNAALAAGAACYAVALLAGRRMDGDAGGPVAASVPPAD